MSISAETIAQILESYLAAEKNHSPIKPVASFCDNITADEAYRVQQTLVAQYEAGGQRIVGKKAASTSAAAQKKMQIDEPIYGNLFDYHQAALDSVISTEHFIRPFIECELAFVFGQSLSGGPGITVADLLAATDYIVAAFDIVDFRTAEWQPGMAEAICYNVYARHFILGQRRFQVDELDLPNVNISLLNHGEQVATATGAAIMGHPARSITWLANKLIEHQRQFKAGDVALTGAITSPHPIFAGDQFEAVYDGMETISVQFS